MYKKKGKGERELMRITKERQQMQSRLFSPLLVSLAGDHKAAAFSVGMEININTCISV